jgi:RNA polymerase sigma-70 factor (ECF subfamily)
LAEDLIQETFLKLCADNYRVLRAFRADQDNPLYAYLRTIAKSVVADYLNSQSALKRGGGLQLLSLDGPGGGAEVGAEDALLQEVERRLILQRVEECLSEQNERNRTIFWLYYRHGFRPAAISAYPGIKVGKSGVEAILYNLTKLVRDCVRRATLRVRGEGVGL